MTTDLIDRLAGTEGVDLADLRRPIAREQAQQSYDSLFSPVDDRDFPVAERWQIAAFATRLTAHDATARYYAEGAREAAPDVAARILAVADGADATGPYGVYPEHGLAAENTEGPRLAVADSAFGARLAAALEHAHLLVKRPREATGAHHQRLLDAGWNEDGIVTLSQLVAFLAFQQRVAIGLRAISEEASA